jgi:hypothetical protein
VSALDTFGPASDDDNEPVVNDEGLTPFQLSRQTIRALDFATQQEQGEADNIGFSARVWAQVSLPYNDPGDVPYWERRNGLVSLTMRPALLTRPDGTRYEAYAYGLLPRKALTWIASEAVRTQDPVLTLGPSMNSFMAKIGLAHGGRDARLLTDQLQRLFGSQLSVQGLTVGTDEGHGEVTKYFSIAEQVQLWFSKNGELDESNDGLWSSQVTLSSPFFRSIVESPLPVNLDALAALGRSPLRHDMYLWFTYRMYGLRKSTRIKWSVLNHQFGGQYAEPRQFKAQFLKHLPIVKIVYPELNVSVFPDYLELHPSPTHVTQTKPRRAIV